MKNIEAVFKTLKRYSFREKIRISQQKSFQSISPDHLLTNPGKIPANYIFPWELEIFTTISILASPEYSFNNFSTPKDYKQLIKIMNTIRNAPELLDKIKNNSSLDAQNLLELMILSQAPLQREIFLKYYRYEKIFSYQDAHIDMPSIITEKFPFTYNDCLKFSYLMYHSFLMFKELAFHPEYQNQKLQNDLSDYLEQIINSLRVEYSHIINYLSIPRKDFISQQLKFIGDNKENIYFAYKLLYRYPIIEEDNLHFLPLIHPLINATTDSILFSITKGDDQIRSDIGKHILENYLYSLLNNNLLYDEIFTECTYKKNRTELRSPDVMIRKNNHIVLLDSKSLVPALELRKLNPSRSQKVIIRIAGFIVQMYKQLKNFNSYYNPFSSTKYTYSRKYIFGLIVLFEENYISREKIFEQVASILEIPEQSPEYKFLCSNIKIVSLHDIELHAYLNSSIIDSLLSTFDGNTLDFGLSHPKEDNNHLHPEIANFRKRLYSDSIEYFKNIILK